MLGDARTRRTVWLATGVAWAVSALLALAQPSLVPLAYSAAWLLFGWSLVLVSRLADARRTRVLGAAIALAAAITGVANLVVNVFSIPGLADWYLYGILVATVLLVPFAYLFARERMLRLVAFTFGLFLGIGFVPPVLGGVIVLALFGALALRTEWFEARSTPPTPEPAR